MSAIQRRERIWAGTQERLPDERTDAENAREEFIKATEKAWKRPDSGQHKENQP